MKISTASITKCPFSGVRTKPFFPTSSSSPRSVAPPSRGPVMEAQPAKQVSNHKWIINGMAFLATVGFSFGTMFAVSGLFFGTMFALSGSAYNASAVVLKNQPKRGNANVAFVGLPCLQSE